MTQRKRLVDTVLILVFFLLSGNQQFISGTPSGSCHRVGFAGPNCQYPDCGAHGVLSSHTFKCDCDEGFQGPNCQECRHTFKTENVNREYLCCPFNLKEKFDPEWRLLAPKIKDSVKFLTGVYTSISCLRPGSLFYQNETAKYHLDCNCQLYVPGEQRKRMFAANEKEEETLSSEVLASNLKRNSNDTHSGTPLELFWRNETKKRDRKVYMTPALFADILISEYANIQATALARLTASAGASASKKTLNATASYIAKATSSCSASDGETLTIIVMSVVLVLILIVAGTVIWCFLRHKKRLYILWKVTQGSTEKTEKLFLESKLVSSKTKSSSSSSSSKKKNNNSPFTF